MDLHPKYIPNDGEPESVLLPYQEFRQIQLALQRLDETPLTNNPRYGGYWDNLAAEEIARRQDVQPVTNLSALAWPYGAEDWDGFEEAVAGWRREHPVE